MQLGIQNLHIAQVIKSGDQRIYSQPIFAAKSIKIDLSVEAVEATLYSHDELIYSEKDFKKGTIILNVADFPTDIANIILNLKQDTDGVQYAGNEDASDPPVFALGFTSKKAGGKIKCVWLLEVTFITPNERYETKSDGINIITPTITGEFTRNPAGLWKSDYEGLPTDAAAYSWFNEVYATENTKTHVTIDLTNLAGLIVTGVWDSTQGRLTC